MLQYAYALDDPGQFRRDMAKAGGLERADVKASDLTCVGEDRLLVLDKRLLFDSDHHPEVSADLEGMTLLDERTLLLVNDNDFGMEDAVTAFWRIECTASI